MTVLKAFGAAVITVGGKEVIRGEIKGTVCYSTQKIRYAPVVVGYNIYPDAYITKLWMVAENALTGQTMLELARPAYEYNYHGDPVEIMFAARHDFTDWADSYGYN